MKKNFNILFVCTGNTCRSPIAQVLLEKKIDLLELDNIRVSSAGINTQNGLSASKNAIKTVSYYNANLKNFKSKILTEIKLIDFDIILTMTNNHKTNLLKNHPTITSKTFLLSEFSRPNEPHKDIEDPIGQNLESYKICAKQISYFLETLISKLQ